MKKEQVMEMDNTEITLEQLEDMEERCPDICKVENLGSSSSRRGCDWYSVEFTDGSSMDIFVK